MFDSLLRKQCSSVLNRFSRFMLKISYSDSALIKNEPKIKAVVEEDATRIFKKEFKGFFIEKIFLDRFQEDVLEYPEIDTKEEIDILKKQVFLAQNFIAAKTDSEVPLLEDNSKKGIALLKKHELIGFKLSRVKNGFGYLQSEYTFMQEALAKNPSLSKTVCEQEDFAIHVINKFGSDLQKEQYLMKLSSGESIACFANIEKETVVTFQNSIKTSAKLSSDKQSYIISGKKCWIYNANCADIFIISANVISDEGNDLKPTLFLVDKNTPGIEVHEPICKIGMKDLSICDVTFNNVIVPTSSVIGSVSQGDEIIRNVLSKGKLSNGSHCLAAMRKLINKSIQHCNHNKHFVEDKNETFYYKAKIASMVSRYYAVESMTYLLTGRLDSHDETADVFLESMIVKIFASEALQFVVRETQGILGVEFFSDENADLLDLSNDAQFYVTCDDANDCLRLVLSLTGLQYTYKHRKDRSLFQLMKDVGHELKTTALLPAFPEYLYFKNVLQGYVHPIFKDESIMLEDAIMNLYLGTKFLIQEYKEKVFEMQSELKIIADILINIYAMTATLGRASRAYCLAVRFQEFDRLCAEIEVRRCFALVRELRDSLRRPEEIISKYETISSSILNFEKYSEFCSVLKNLKIQEQKTSV